jgi:hypothetical protein
VRRSGRRLAQSVSVDTVKPASKPGAHGPETRRDDHFLAKSGEKWSNRITRYASSIFLVLGQKLVIAMVQSGRKTL